MQVTQPHTVQSTSENWLKGLYRHTTGSPPKSLEKAKREGVVLWSLQRIQATPSTTLKDFSLRRLRALYAEMPLGYSTVMMYMQCRGICTVCTLCMLVPLGRTSDCQHCSLLAPRWLWRWWSHQTTHDMRTHQWPCTMNGEGYIVYNTLVNTDIQNLSWKRIIKWAYNFYKVHSRQLAHMDCKGWTYSWHSSGSTVIL